MVDEKKEIYDDFVQALVQEDTLGAIIRAHIHVEERIYDVVETMLFDPSLIRKAKFRYEQACILVVALGLKEELLPPMKFIGKMRNEFAHKLDRELTKEDMDNFYQCFSSEDKKIISTTYEKIRDSLSEGNDNTTLAQRNPRIRFACYSTALRAAIVTALEQAKEIRTFVDG